MMKSKTQLSSDTIINYLPDAPEGYLGYQVEFKSHMWWSIWLLHPPYSYKEGVRTIHSFVKRNGDVYAPLTSSRPAPTMTCRVFELFKQNPYTLIKPKDLGYRLIDLI